MQRSESRQLHQHLHPNRLPTKAGFYMGMRGMRPSRPLCRKQASRRGHHSQTRCTLLPRRVVEIVRQYGFADADAWMANWEAAWQVRVAACRSLLRRGCPRPDWRTAAAEGRPPCNFCGIAANLCPARHAPLPPCCRPTWMSTVRREMRAPAWSTSRNCHLLAAGHALAALRHAAQAFHLLFLVRLQH